MPFNQLALALSSTQQQKSISCAKFPLIDSFQHFITWPVSQTGLVAKVVKPAPSKPIYGEIFRKSAHRTLGRRCWLEIWSSEIFNSRFTWTSNSSSRRSSAIVHCCPLLLVLLRLKLLLVLLVCNYRETRRAKRLARMLAGSHFGLTMNLLPLTSHSGPFFLKFAQFSNFSKFVS